MSIISYQINNCTRRVASNVFAPFAQMKLALKELTVWMAMGMGMGMGMDMGLEPDRRACRAGWLLATNRGRQACRTGRKGNIFKVACQFWMLLSVANTPCLLSTRYQIECVHSHGQRNISDANT